VLLLAVAGCPITKKDGGRILLLIENLKWFRIFFVAMIDDILGLIKCCLVLEWGEEAIRRQDKIHSPLTFDNTFAFID